VCCQGGLAPAGGLLQAGLDLLLVLSLCISQLVQAVTERLLVLGLLMRQLLVRVGQLPHIRLSCLEALRPLLRRVVQRSGHVLQRGLLRTLRGDHLGVRVCGQASGRLLQHIQQLLLAAQHSARGLVLHVLHTLCEPSQPLLHLHTELLQRALRLPRRLCIRG
jgi:hypothetical protein